MESEIRAYNKIRCIINKKRCVLVYVIAWGRGQLKINFTHIFKVFQIALVAVARIWPNYYKIMQHLQMLHEKFDHFQFWANNTQHVTTRCDTVAKRTWLVSPGNVAIVWLGLKMVNSFVCYIMLWSFGQVLATMLNPGMRTNSIFNTQHVATRQSKVATVMKVLYNVVICCVHMLLSFGRDIRPPSLLLVIGSSTTK